MRYVKASTTIPLPEVFDYNVSSDSNENPVGYPYMLMEALGGRVLQADVRKSVPEEYQDKVLSTVASYIIQLSTIRFPLIGRLEETRSSNGTLEYKILPCLHPAGCQWRNDSGPFATSIDYFYTTRKLDYEEFLKRMPNDSDDCFAAWIRLQAAVAIIQPEFKQGPFPLHHPDLRLANILFDEDYNVVGIIDWSFTMTVPIEAFVNLQSDFGADDCRDSFIKYLRIHESRIDPNTPLSNYLLSSNSATKAIIELQALTPLKKYRMPMARSLLRKLFGENVRWKMVKRAWMRSELYPTGFKDRLNHAWLWTATVGVSIGITFYCVQRVFRAPHC